MGEDRPTCPDLGTCHHECQAACFRVISCGPLSGVYPDDEWPERMVKAHARRHRRAEAPEGFPEDSWANAAEVEAFIEEQLDRKARGLPVDEETLVEAGVMLAGTALVSGGARLEDVVRQFDERPFSVRFVRNAEKLEVTIDWGEETADV